MAVGRVLEILRSKLSLLERLSAPEKKNVDSLDQQNVQDWITIAMSNHVSLFHFRLCQ